MYSKFESAVEQLVKASFVLLGKPSYYSVAVLAFAPSRIHVLGKVD